MQISKYLKSDHIPYIVGVLLLTLATYRVLHFFHLPHLDTLANVSYQPITGHPFWRAFQNRLLGGGLMHVLMSVTGISQLTAFKVASLGILTATMLSAYVCFAKLQLTAERTLSYTGSFALGILLIQDQKWIMIWDYLDLLIFLFFFYGIFKHKQIGYFLALFLVGIVNRESALFIPLWLILDGIRLKPFISTGWKWKKVIIGSVMMVGGILYTWWIRQTLFIESHVDRVGKDLSHAMISNHWNLPANFEALFNNLIYFQLDIVGTLFAVLIIGYSIYNWREMGAKAKKVVVLMLGMILSIWLFGLINELRQYLILLPGAVFLYHHVGKNNSRPIERGSH